MYSIYKVTNILTSQVYIGQTKRPLKVRWRQHIRDSRKGRTCFKLQQAIKEYGEKNFIIEELQCTSSKEQADLAERMWIKYYDSTVRGYNTAKGGMDSGNRKRVFACESGIVFDSMMDACRFFGLSHGAIHNVIGRDATAAGQHWVFAGQCEKNLEVDKK